jgi:hypothetical protein
MIVPTLMSDLTFIVLPLLSFEFEIYRQSSAAPLLQADENTSLDAALDLQAASGGLIVVGGKRAGFDVRFDLHSLFSF